MRDYRDKLVQGFVADIEKPLPKKCEVYVRMTSDEKGQSLSLQAYNIMIGIPLESVKDIIRISEKESKE